MKDILIDKTLLGELEAFSNRSLFWYAWGMKKLEPHKQITVNHDIVAQILRSYNVSHFSYEVITQGIQNTSLIITGKDKKFVLRIHEQGRKEDAEIAFELVFQDYLREHGIPIPYVYKNTEGKEYTIVEIDSLRWQVILMEFAEGASSTQNITPELITDLASLQVKMHVLGIEYVKERNGDEKVWTELVDGLAQKIPDTSVYEKKTQEFIERARLFRYVLSPTLPHGWNHLDLDFEGNVIVKDNKVNAIVDFDDLDYSPAVVCLGFTLWGMLCDTGKEGMWQYLNEYEKIRPLMKEEHDALPHVMLFRNYAIQLIDLGYEQKIEDQEKFIQLETEIPKIFGE